MTDKAQFKVLDDVSHIILRKGMYVGSTTPETVQVINEHGESVSLSINPALIKIISEIIENSVDEFIRTEGKHANILHVDITQNIEGGVDVVIEDNGRGIPVVEHEGGWQPELAWLRARAGSNFDDSQGRMTGGMNGVGSFLTAIFSTDFKGISRDGKSICAVEANNGIKKSVSVTKQKLKTTGCKVAFTPAMEHFPDVNLGDLQSYMRLRLINLAVSMRKMDIYFNGAQLDNKYRLSAGDDQISLFSDNSLLMIASAQEFTQHTYVNGLFCRHGGSIPDAIASQIVIPLREMISKKHKIDMLPSQIKQHLKVGSWSTGFPNLQFDSQTKDRVTNPTGECLAFLNFDWKKLATQIMKTPSLIDPMIQSALYKKELADRLELARAQKAKKKVRIASHIECTGDKNRTLFLFEGESAANAFLEVRDPKKHGAYALRGKVLNTHGMKWVDIVKNRELSDLMEIIGLKPDKPATMLNYDRILITTDADLDGADITCLLVNFFSRWPELFDGIISRVKSPLWIGTSKTERIYCYSNAEYMKSQKRGIEWNYMKGLGRLEVEDYRTMIETPVIDKISYKGVESLTIAFGDSAQARKDWMQS